MFKKGELVQLTDRPPGGDGAMWVSDFHDERIFGICVSDKGQLPKWQSKNGAEYIKVYWIQLNRSEWEPIDYLQAIQ